MGFIHTPFNPSSQKIVRTRRDKATSESQTHEEENITEDSNKIKIYIQLNRILKRLFNVLLLFIVFYYYYILFIVNVFTLSMDSTEMLREQQEVRYKEGNGRLFSYSEIKCNR